MRVPRRDETLNDKIEVLQDHYLHCQQNVAQAWGTLDKDARAFVEGEIEHCLDLRYYLENYHFITTEQGVLKTLYPFWDHQEMVYEAMQEEWATNGYCKLIILKPRQTGISVWTAAAMFHRTITTPHCFTMIVAQNDVTSEHIYKMSINAYYNLPWWLRPEFMYKTKKGAIEFQRADEKERMMDPGLGSVLQVSPATQTSGVAIGRTIRALHACLTENNTVVDEYGMAISIAEAGAGHSVVDGEGNLAKISAYSQKLAKDIYPGAENGYRITTWGSPGFPIEGTGNHKILGCNIYTLRHREEKKWIRERALSPLEMVPLHKLTKRWMGVAVPVLPIHRHGHVPGAEERPLRKQGGGKMSYWNPPEPSQEFGFAVGLYLAEGNGTGRCLTLALDSDEEHLADRFAKAVGVEGIKRPDKKSKTVRYCFGRSAMRDWFAKNVGHLKGKRIQPWMWNVGREFLAGILEGMILGDGHISPREHSISISTTREQLAISLRWIVAALGHGWSDILMRKAGFYYGRNCKQIWTFRVCQRVDQLIRQEYGWSLAPKKKLKDVSHWMYTADRKHIVCPIRKIERVPLKFVYDIEVQNNDHTFLLPAALTHNSEVSRWPNDEVYEGDIKPSMNAFDTLQVFESTGYGRQGLFYDQWCAAEEGDNDMRAVFIAVYKVKKYYLPIKGGFELAPDEATFNERIKKEEHFEIPDEFWNFRRVRMRAAKRSGTKAGFLESYPLTPVEAFQSSGLCAFDRDSLEWQSMNKVCKPLFAGEISLVSMEPPRINTDDILEVKDDEILPRRKSGRGGKRLHVWEWPEKESTYYVSADVALGNGGDYSVAVVYRAGVGMEPDTMVATWWGWIPPKAFAKVLCAIGFFYNGCEMAIEYAKDGITTANEVRDADYPNLYRPQWKDKINNQASNYLHWYTNSKTRDEIIGCMNEALLDRTVVIRDADALDEMIDFAALETGGKSQGQGNEDDGVMSGMIGLYCVRETTKHLKTTVAVEHTRATGELHVYGVYDNLMRQRGQYNTQGDAEKMIQGKAGWRVQPILVCNANTLFSPIFDAMGAEHELHSRYGIRTTEITPDLVWAYKGAMKSAGPGGVDEFGDEW